MAITILKANHGDSILIEEEKNVLIDAGPTLTDEIKSFLNRIIERQEFINLLVVTHYDDDHIGGVLELFSNPEYINLVETVWFNGERSSTNIGNQYLSKKQQTQLASILSKKNITWKNVVKKDDKFVLSNKSSIEVLYSCEHASEDLEGKMTSGAKSDWACRMKDLDTDYLDRAPDNSKSNAESIVLLYNYEGKKILLPGDATPKVLLEVLKDYSIDKPAKFDYIKLPHHGSYRNISKEILERIECNDFIVSTDGNIFFHPNKRAILKLAKWRHNETKEKLKLHFNYWEQLKDKLYPANNSYLNLKIEQDNYNFECDGETVFFN